MAEYYPLLARAVARLPESTPETRRAVYERARQALIGQLRKTEPPIPEEAIQVENLALDAAAARLEGELAQASAAPPPPPPRSPPPTSPSATSPSAAPPSAAPAPTPPPAPPAGAPAPPQASARPAPPTWATPHAASKTGDTPREPRPTSGSGPILPRTPIPSFAPRPSALPPAPPPAFRPTAPNVPSAEPQSWPPAPKAAAPEPRLAEPAAIEAIAAPKALPPELERAKPPEVVIPAEVESDEDLQGDEKSPYWRRFGQSRSISDSQPATDAEDEIANARADARDRDAGEGYTSHTPSIEPITVQVSRPAAPVRDVVRPRAKGLWIGALLVLLVMGAVGTLAYRMRDNPADYSRSRTQPAAEAPAAANPGKIVERIGGSARSGAAAPAAPAASAPNAGAPNAPAADAGASTSGSASAPLPVGQRAALLVEAPNEQQQVKTFFGTVLWKLERASPDALPVLRADIAIPEARLTATMMISRNIDPNAIASHIITLRFTPAPDSAISSVTEIETPSMRIEDRPVGEALEGKAAPVQANYFFVGLIRDDTMMKRNLELLKGRPWIDVPMRLNSGKIAKITFEKGPQGERLLQEALDAWK